MGADNPLRLAKLGSSPDRAEAKEFPRLTAESIGRQAARLGALATVVLAYDYEEMFKRRLALDPDYSSVVRREIDWAERVLRKQDRIVWYLRWVRLSVAAIAADAARNVMKSRKPDAGYPAQHHAGTRRRR